MNKYHLPEQIFIQKIPFEFFSSKHKSIVSDQTISPSENLLPPFSLENKPRKGFILNNSILQQDNFYKTNHSVIILDPLGIEYEISQGNLIELLKSSNLTDGVFEEEMIIGFKGKKLVLMPTKNFHVQEAIKNKKTKFNILNTNIAKIGRTYFISNKNLVFLGYQAIKTPLIQKTEETSVIQTHTKTMIFEHELQNKYVFIDPEDSSFHFYRSFNVNSCINYNEHYKTEYFIDIFKIINTLDFDFRVLYQKTSIKDLLNLYFRQNHVPLILDNLLIHIQKAFHGYYFISNSNSAFKLICEKHYFSSSLYINDKICNMNKHGYLFIKNLDTTNSIIPTHLITDILSENITDSLKHNKIAELINDELNEFQLAKLVVLSNDELTVFLNNNELPKFNHLILMANNNNNFVTFTKDIL